MTPSSEKDHTGQPQSNTSTLPFRLPHPGVSSSGSLPNNKVSISNPFTETIQLVPASETRLSHSIEAFPAPGTKSPSSSRTRSLDRSSVPASTSLVPSIANDEEGRQIIVRSFAPRIAVHASPDTEDFVREKGFKTGLWSLLRPFGERVQGKVAVRDSIGASRSWDDFGVRIFDPRFSESFSSKGSVEDNLAKGFWGYPPHQNSSGPLLTIESVLKHSLETQASEQCESTKVYSQGRHKQPDNNAASSSLFTKYLRRLLSSASIVPHETFCHPVACLIAVSSRNTAPIEALRQLYAQTGRANLNIPPWVGVEYLRYYVLVHDEENDDIARSTTLFDLMKKHFGLHCHLLRLKSSQCVSTDDDSFPVPSCQWLSAEEELVESRRQDSKTEIEETQLYIGESDACAINALVREMVTQSIVPYMESRVVTWNDQVASRRRGLSGRFMSLSKRWTGFGSSRGTTANSGSSGSFSGSNYDVQNGFYPPEAPEATMRQLADYAIMLRDWKLAYTTYDILRSDFAHAKAWAYHAAANEMAAVSFLLLSSSQSKVRCEIIDQMLETALYSYVTRYSSFFGAARGLMLGMELLHSHGSLAADHAARWAGRLLELGIIGPASQTAVTERIAEYYMSRVDFSLVAQSPRRRQAALWSILAAYSWNRLGKSSQVEVWIQAVDLLYGLSSPGMAQLPYPSMRSLWETLRIPANNEEQAELSTLIDTSSGLSSLHGSRLLVEKEQMDAFVRRPSKAHTDDEGFTFSTLEVKNEAGDGSYRSSYKGNDLE